MDPSVSLARLERSLRLVMTVCYRERFGNDWLDHVTRPEQRDIWADRADDEARRRTARGVAITPAGGLEYANLHDLRRIAERHWDPVAPALGALRETKVMLERFDHMRNTVAHSRELMPFEADLLAGIAGDIGNRVTIFMSNQDPSGDFYPRITSALDQFGNEATVEQLTTPETCWVRSGQTLRPGDSVTFTCRGVDPQGRRLDWGLQLVNGSMGPHDAFYVDRAYGDDVTLTWQVAGEHVRDDGGVFVVLIAGGTPYHRNGWVDQMVAFGYRVIPGP